MAHHISDRMLMKICKILIKEKDEERKQLKYKCLNGSIKKYNKISKKEIGLVKHEDGKEKHMANRKVRLNKMKKEIKVMESKMKQNDLEDEEYWQEKDVKDGEERFTSDYEDCKQSFKRKKVFGLYFKSHLIGHLTCKKYDKTFGYKKDF